MEHHTPAGGRDGFCQHNLRVLAHLLGHLTQRKSAVETKRLSVQLLRGVRFR
jgi:hypothetical protein